MTTLVLPDLRWFPGWAATVADFGGKNMHGSGDWNLDQPLEPTEESCHAFMAALAASAPGDPGGGKVPSTYYWITAEDGGPDDEVIGFLNLRHDLNDFLLEEGGHIGYSVRPARRRQGHASRALGLSVAAAGALGIDRVLLTCDTDNEASARTIEANGGVLEDVRKGKRRYWVTVPSSQRRSGARGGAAGGRP
ncbi:GNAT family N-acetyltransferase [Nocardioides stalactiti]|uniref:GNAT family N-acetyltransferase n=1 Tax=Nocardioides stalactiti TaxID=2755356 RepID=UPI0016016E45|nr:GNAT family N-acetyltransferase [Nocardioides stalactiti]